MRKLGVVQEIWRYPVKGMAGESLNRCQLTAQGLLGDRLWAVRDTLRDEVQSCKFRPQLLQVKASWDTSGAEPVKLELLFPDGSRLASNSKDVDERLSALLGRTSTLEALESDTNLRRYKADADDSWLDELKATFEREPGEPLPDFSDLPQDMIDFVSLPGSYFLVSPFHLLTTASLDYLQQLHPDSDWDVQRFRPNLVVDTLDAEAGLIEQAWLDGRLQIGEAELRCTSTAPRCGAITRAQQHLPADKSLLRTVVREADQNLGIYADTLTAGELRVGDPVYMRD